MSHLNHSLPIPKSLPVLTWALAPVSQLNLAGNKLCGVYIDNRTFELKGTYTAEGIQAIADALKGNGALTRLDVRYNSMKDEGVKLLRDAVKGREGFILIDHSND